MANRLAEETSPYLLQHAHNPVDWYPWGEEATSLAHAQDKPILLSIGYSACHWCHVMERESFEDSTVAAVMNDLFVNVKVDREERPDIDQIYMKAVQAMTGGGGWPLTAFLTPEGTPFYGGTYFPPVPHQGIPSFTQVLHAAADAYKTRPDDVRGAGEKLLAAIKRASAATRATDGSLSDALIVAYRTLSNQYDSVHGGFGRAPKFPQPVTLELLLRHHLREGDEAGLEMVVFTLRRMAAGGMRDHLAGGFHRYSVDDRWLVPHFEKMLYDNGLLARAYVDAYRVTGLEDLRAVAEQTLEYLTNDMQAPGGGFYAARDADSEGEEGIFYVWTLQELESALGSDEARLFARVYDVSDGGNFEGRNILHLPHELSSISRAEGITQAQLEETLECQRRILLDKRARREPPFRDEKILVSWNSMAIRAFAEAGPTLNRWGFVDTASKAALWIWAELRPGGQLLRVLTDGIAKIPAFLEDYAALGNALLSVHSATLELRWLHAVRALCDEMIERFWSEDDNAFYDTPRDGEKLIFRPRDPLDNATPSGASLAAELLLRAGHVFDNHRYSELALSSFERDGDAIMRFGPGFGRMLSVVDRSLAPPLEVAIIGEPSDPRTRSLIQAAHSIPARNLTIVGGPPGEELADIPLLRGRGTSGEKPTAYVCREYVCDLPVTDPEEVRNQMLQLCAS